MNLTEKQVHEAKTDRMKTLITYFKQWIEQLDGKSSRKYKT